MARNIPPGGSISQNIRGKKRGKPRPIEADNKITPHIGVHIGRCASNRPVTRRSSGASEPYRIQGKPVVEKRLGKRTLEKLLIWGQQEEQKCMKLLKVLPPELPEYNEVLDKLDKLQEVQEQVKRQLVARE